MQILQIVAGLPSKDRPFYQPFIKSQIESLKKLGLSITIYTFKGYTSRFNYFKAIRDVRKIFKKNKFDLIHAHYSYCGLAAVFAATKRPIILSLMGSDLLGSPDFKGNLTLKGRFDKFLTRYIIKKVNHIIVKSEEMSNIVSQNNNIPISIVPNGVDFNFFKPFDYLESRKELGIGTDEFLILFLGNPDEPRKNFPLARDSVSQFKHKFQSEKIRIIYPFGIHQTKIVKYMSASDVLLSTSYWEGSPNVIKEAMACNLPIISTDVGDIRKVINNTENCFIIPFDKEEIVEKLAIIYNNRKRSNGREKIQYLKEEIIAENIANIYKSTLSNYN